MKKQNNILRAIFTVLAIIILVNAGSAFAASAKNSRIASGAPTVKTRTVQPAEANSSEVTASKASGSKASKKSSAKTVEAKTAKNTIKATGKAVKTAKTDDSVSASKVSASKTAKASGKTTKTTKTAAKATKTTKTTKPPTLKIDSNTSGMSSEEAKIYKTLKAQMKKMPEGMPWSNANSYQFRGGIFGTGYGCSGFAFKMSDTVFGDKPAKLHTNYNNIRVGDIIRMNGNTHSVIVLKVVGDTFVVAEGNYNASIHWGRLIKRSEVKATGTYVMSRY